MKKLLAILLACLTLVGCSSSDGTLDLTTIQTNITDAVDAEGNSLVGNVMIGGVNEVSFYGIEPSSVEEALLFTPMMNIKATTIIIMKAVEGKEEEVSNALKDYMVSYEEQWSTYLPDQYELVKNRIEEEFLGYEIVIIAADNEEIFQLIKDSEVK